MTAPTAPASHDATSAAPASDTGAWTLWTVLRRTPTVPTTTTAPTSPSGPTPPTAPTARTVGPALSAAAADLPDGVVLRGIYDVSGLRSDADLMLWLHGGSAEDLQAAARTLRRSTELAGLHPTWSAMGVHRPAEFSADHAPAYMRSTAPRRWLTVYPFVRSYEWYLLPADERRAMLGEHGRKGRAFTTVLANTVAAFALGDYEWLLGLEADDLTDLVDLMRDLRDTQARRHVREEIPFFTGRLITVDEVAEVLR
ncbi:hydrogen peroxide-dependent heme synthase [Cellulomonas sp. KRMCY2]|uniref:hydrogen peroxide-dependent heme synthase n=1 Tax=Cellulomonas sp. KRMCY2 TaxID=1304865 RepID=UPI00045E8069|nr:hydrogen peroxide-dependent heme synthase [Cellulomonas sp. KRMCY2]